MNNERKKEKVEKKEGQIYFSKDIKSIYIYT